MASPQILKGWLVSVDGRGLAGRVAETSFVNLDSTKVERRAGDQDVKVQEYMGQEAMMYKMALYSYEKEVIDAWGRTITGATDITIRGGWQEAAQGSTQSHVHNMRVSLPSIPAEMYKPGEITTVTFEFDVYYYKWTVDGDRLIEIDPENRIRYVNGENQLEAMNAALGYSGADTAAEGG